MLHTAEYKQIGEMIASCRETDFCARLAEWIRTDAAVDTLTMVVYRGSEPPIHLYDDFRNETARAGMMTYLTSTYVLNAFFQRHQTGLHSGVYRIRDLAPDAYLQSELYKGYEVVLSEREEIGYVTEGWPQGLEEIDIAVSLGNLVTAEIGLYRATDRGGFADEAIRLFQARMPVIEAAFHAYWSYSESRPASEEEAPRPNARIGFETFGACLTSREREVVTMILRGHSSESISYNLGISITTVKTHRKRAYEKLNISTQAELLSLFLEHVQSNYNAPH
ncbi:MULTISPECIES: helix-turn-helix transcriptional regulator [Rhizobium]|uniref:HTH luxR-type domain-containing protein n=2 Tax=Rhizobium TaxID=379 RepID=A0A109J244_9HYPH|nr:MULTISPECIES: LuxR family transcriptional regulator [Rhizobium]KWV40936.1 hypothetical protein AS026_24535 [Rhizobium altiplani]KWV48009.1 hypothetical protein AS026_12290 [Rhizobium altiplani]KWV48058.1 hypothetical protein AS026_12135 [Rhizobium altiplani]KWV54591.1 hypothetical protein AS026_38760 [Rhizobium altiplani]MDQ0561084.1 DNA-binding CsgD family transcriptional regulator [Rhizobium mesoamericanum]